MVNSTWLIFGGLGITAIVALIIGTTNSSSDSSFESINNSNYTSLPDYSQPASQNYEQPENSYDDARYNMQPYGGTRKKKMKRIKKIKKHTKRSKK